LLHDLAEPGQGRRGSPTDFAETPGSQQADPYVIVAQGDEERLDDAGVADLAQG